MMLIQGSLPGSIETPFSLAYDHGKGAWMHGTETWQKFPKCEETPQDACEVFPVMEGKGHIDDSFSLNVGTTSSQISTVTTKSENSAPAFVYRRRKLHRTSLSAFPGQAPVKPSDGCLSAISSEAPSVAAMSHVVSLVELESEVVGASVIPAIECSAEAIVLKSESINGHPVREDHGSREAPKGDINRALDFCSVNDSYSSSKSNVELGSTTLRTEVDDTGECSSSSALVVVGSQDEPSEKDTCISILRSQGLLEAVSLVSIPPFTEGPGTSDNSHIRTCKVCDHPDTTKKMLICDQCDEAFHVSCCNPRLRKIPVDEWFCHSCLKKKHKILKETTPSKALNISTEMSSCRNATSEVELGPIESMLMDTEPYLPGVRIGPDFQAEVPDWAGPSIDGVNIIDEPSEINPSDCVSLHGCDISKPSRHSSIGNWLQCRQVIDGIGEGVDGNICGKWRRAPLFEVQTDDWECFGSVLWDPAHADCAVPQELDTDQILKHLKYIEMLRPRLAAKRRKLDHGKDVGSQDLAEDTRNIRSP